MFVIAAAFHIPVEHLLTRTAIHLELMMYDHDVPIFFQRGPRVFRLVGPDDQEQKGWYESWREAVQVARREGMPLIAVYSRTGYMNVP